MRESQIEDLIFGKVLRAMRLNVGKSQEDLAMDAGLERTFISMLELGQRRPTIKTLIALGNGLGMPLSDLMRGFEEKYYLETGKPLVETAPQNRIQD